MKLSKNFPAEFDEAKVLFVTLPKCYSAEYDIKNKKLSVIEYYAIAKHENITGVTLFSIDEHFNVISSTTFSNAEEAMYELEPDNISLEDWKRIISKNTTR